MKNSRKRPIYIREWRDHRNLTQEKLADRLEMTQAYLSKLERGVAPYNQAVLEAIADALTCEPADLIMRPPEADQDIRMVWSQLTPENRVKALEIIKLLKTG